MNKKDLIKLFSESGIRVQDGKIRKSDAAYLAQAIAKADKAGWLAEPVDLDNFEKFAKSYDELKNVPYFKLRDMVEPAGDDQVKFKAKHVKDLKRTYKLFTDGKAAQEYLDGVEAMLVGQIKKALEKQKAKVKDFEITTNIGDSSCEVQVTHKKTGVEADFDGGFYYDDNSAYEHMSDGFSSWEWLAILADNDSPWHSDSFVDGYMETEKYQMWSELADLNTDGDLDEKVKSFLNEIAEESES